ncbi:hypothetical protein CA13_40260 [Planctomycetes bacterium CA13]|uniref:Transmembrane protein n=1 Tax=Novipirellula herctigrandis TaxID=2527986 RepID=A0A5C5Z7S8_9BACT|nr:hypothetical protein CA13_40260 [Planctomycetes bacterium CA13]
MTPSTDSFPPADSSCESIAELVSRLGKPPESVVEVWCNQLRDAAIDHENRLGHPLAEIDLAQWFLGPEGELWFAGQCYACPPTSQFGTPMNAASEERIEVFRNAVLGNSVFENAVLGTEETIRPELPTTDQSEFGKEPKSKSKKGWFAAAAAGLLFALLMAYPFIRRDASVASNRNESVSAPSQPPLKGVASDPKSPEAIRDESLSLETFDNAPDLTDESPVPELHSLLSVDSLLPAVPRVVSPPSHGIESAEAEQTQSSDAPNMSLGANDPNDGPATVDALEAVPDAELPEAPQRVRIAPVQANAFPVWGDDPDPSLIDNLSPGKLTLQFPIDVPMVLVPGESKDGYFIHDSRSETDVATLEVVDGSYAFQWANEIKSASAAATLHHGRLQDAKGHITYLRQSVEADPWPMAFAQTDYRPTWELGGMIPPNVTRITVDFELPEDIEIGWIDPVDPASPRRAKALAVLTHRKQEFVQIAVRMNIRCTSKMSCEIRFAGRLDPSMPWQTFTEDGLAQLANQLIERSSVLNELHRRSEAIYDQASSSQRQNLRPQREQLKAQIKIAAEMSERLAVLQAGVAELQLEGKIRCELLVRWPDGDQAVLSMPILEKDGDSGDHASE